jgi:hypothetical protein
LVAVHRDELNALLQRLQNVKIKNINTKVSAV